MSQELRSTVTFLQMFGPPARPWRAPPRPDLSVVQIRPVTAGFYRPIYNDVGAPWRWAVRRRMSDANLEALLNDPRIELHVLYVGAWAVGFGELDGRVEGEIEIRYFGIRPDWIGQGLGPYFLDCLTRMVWRRDLRRFWLHTCTHDHPAALAMYQRGGFEPYHRCEETQIDPFLDGTIPCPPGGFRFPTPSSS